MRRSKRNDGSGFLLGPSAGLVTAEQGRSIVAWLAVPFGGPDGVYRDAEVSRGRGRAIAQEHRFWRRARNGLPGTVSTDQEGGKYERRPVGRVDEQGAPEVSDIRAICHRDLLSIHPEASLADAARAMSEAGEDVLLVSTPEGILGLVSDRDIVVQGVAKGLETKNTPVEDIMRFGLPA